MKYPVNSYLFVFSLLFLVIFTLFKSHNFSALPIYGIVFCSLFYYFFCRKSAKIALGASNSLKIIYFFPWDKTQEIDLKKIRKFDYARGFYGKFSDKSLGYGNLLRICYDLLILVDDEGKQTEIKLNLRIFAFKRLIKFLKSQPHLVFEHIESEKFITW